MNERWTEFIEEVTKVCKGTDILNKPGRLFDLIPMVVIHENINGFCRENILTYPRQFLCRKMNRRLAKLYNKHGKKKSDSYHSLWRWQRNRRRLYPI